MSWRARKGLLPRSATNVSSAARGKPKRLVLADDVITAARRSAARMQLRRAEKIRDLDGGGLRRIRAMNDVLLDAQREVSADRTGCGLLGIRGAHDLAIAGNCVIAFEHLHDD